ncbi:MAG: hypothetical protein KDK91_10630 [Gammaproteobacteria bacterium]|nr:hypothetical protein [Gammaproteobacteria bacterium]
MKRDRAGWEGELGTYTVGLILALMLTLMAFASVAWLGVSRQLALGLVAVLGVVQIVVHLRFFLHVDLSAQKREDLQLILFSALILGIMIAGTIWIMGSLHLRMGGGESGYASRLREPTEMRDEPGHEIDARMGRKHWQYVAEMSRAEARQRGKRSAASDGEMREAWGVTPLS